jgi:spore germination protein
MKHLSKELAVNRSEAERLVNGCDDILIRPMKLGKEKKTDCFLVYIETAVSNMMLEDSVIGKLLGHLEEMEESSVYQSIRENALGISDTKELFSMEEAMAAVLAGNAVLFVDHYDRAIKIGSKGYPGAGVQKAESEKVLRGSKEAFSESEKINTALIRKRIRDTHLKVKELPLGELSSTMTAILYMEDLVCPLILENIQRRLEGLQLDGILDSGQVEQLTEENWYSPFPQYQTTERPDRAAMALLEGRVVVVVDNSPEALLLPATMNSLFQTSDDYYRHFGIVSFLRLVRYAAAFLAVSLPGLYLSVTTLHPQILPTNLIVALAKAREGVPFPGLLEVLILELSFELLREAGLRMPGPIGNTIGIVGGLIVGQAAVSANLVSPMVVVVVAMTALGSFSIPNEELSEAFRLIKYVFLFLSAWFGILGLSVGWFLLLTHLARLKSFGISYLAPFSAWELNQKEDAKDSLVRFPLIFLTRRPVFARRGNRIRMKRKE